MIVTQLTSNGFLSETRQRDIFRKNRMIWLFQRFRFDKASFGSSCHYKLWNLKLEYLKLTEIPNVVANSVRLAISDYICPVFLGKVT